MKYTSFFLALITVFQFSCNNTKEDSVFPKVQPLDSLQSSAFVPALNVLFKTDTNQIYAATVAYVWDEIKMAVKDPVTQIESDLLNRINISKSHKGVLLPNEYSADFEVEGNVYRASAYFRKSLQFKEPLDTFRTPILFNDIACKSFGCTGWNEMVQIIYYTSDDDFAIRLKPKNNTDEIIVSTCNYKSQTTLLSEINRIKVKKEQFKEEHSADNHWRHHLKDEDKVRIPKIAFNLAYNYNDIQGSGFETATKDFILDELYQRTAFVLNENGAEVESVAYAVATEEAMMEELPTPKNLLFNKPFVVMLKRKDNPNPYFAAFISNAELLVKQLQ